MIINDNLVKQALETGEDIPQTLKQVILGSKWREKVDEICHHEGCEEESVNVQYEVLFVLTFVTSAEDLPYALVAEAGLDEEKADKLSRLISDKVLAPIKKAAEVTS